MKNYKIIIEETISDEFTVSANSSKEAVEIAKQKYRDCEFVLSPGNIQAKQITVLDHDNEFTEWEEF